MDYKDFWYFKMFNFIVFLQLTFITIFMLNFCSDVNTLGPKEEYLPELADAIPYNILGSGVIVLERVGPYPGEYDGCYVIDIDQQKCWPLDFTLANSYYVSPNGRKIVFTMSTGYETAYDVYVVNVDGTNLERLTSLVGQDRFPSWSPDGTKIYFSLEGSKPPSLYSQSPNKDANDLNKICEFLIRPQPSDPEYIISPSGAVSISVKGKITYASNASRGVNLAGIYLMDTNGQNRSLIVPLENSKQFESPVFSPNGEKISYLSVLRDSLQNYQKIDIMQINLDNPVPVLIKSFSAKGSKEWHQNSKYNNVYLTYSPDGSKFLINIPEDDFVSHLYMINSDGSKLTQVTFAEGVTDRCASWGK